MSQIRIAGKVAGSRRGFRLVTQILLACAVMGAAGSAYAVSLSVIEEAAQSGERGLRVLTDEARPGYVEDDTPAAATRYRARFYIRADDLSLPYSSSFDLFAGYDAGGTVEFVVRLLSSGGQINLSCAVADSGGILTGFGPSQRILLLDGWHLFEIDWRTGPGVGLLNVFLDGSLRIGISGINNAAGALDYVRLGAVTAPHADAQGYLDIDGFVSRETDYIGAPPMAFPIPPINVNVNAPNTVGSLVGRFMDLEDGFLNLTFSVVDISNPALFTAVFTNSAVGNITIDYAPDAPGTSEITIRATDADDLFVDSTFTVNVNGPPTAVTIPDFEVEANAPDTVINLWDIFDDAEDADADLVYSLFANSNSGLFDSLTIDQAAGTFTLDYASGISGEAEITLRATDSGGLAVNTMFTVTVAAPPIVYHNADTNQDNALNLSELLRVIQFFNSGISCAIPPGSTEDGFVPLIGGDQSCTPHSSDYNPQSWSITLSELLRVVQIFNSAGYTKCPGGEDGFCLL
jgi:hypothetical protein